MFAMRISEQSPKGVAGVQHVVARHRAGHAVPGEQIGVGDAAHDRMVVLAPHQIEVGRGQHGHGYPGIGETPRQRRDLCRRQQRQLGHMAGHDPAAAAVALGQFEHVMDVHLPGIVADIEMHIDIDIELAGKRKDRARSEPAGSLSYRGAAPSTGAPA